MEHFPVALQAGVKPKEPKQRETKTGVCEESLGIPQDALEVYSVPWNQWTLGQAVESGIILFQNLI